MTLGLAAAIRSLGRKIRAGMRSMLFEHDKTMARYARHVWVPVLTCCAAILWGSDAVSARSPERDDLSPGHDAIEALDSAARLRTARGDNTARPAADRHDGPPTGRLSEVSGNSLQAPIRVRDFLDGLGMNIRAKDVASQYGNARMVVERLNYLAIGRVREGFPARELGGHARACYEIIAGAGIKYNLTTHNEKAVADIVADIAAFERRYPGTVIAVEGPNELNNWPIAYQGQKGPIAGKAYMSDLYAAIKADPTLAAANVPVYGVTDWPSLATKADLANIHSYERSAYGSYKRVRRDRDDELAAFAADVVTLPGSAPRWVVTETGFHTWLGSGYFEGVDPPTQAKLGLNLFFNVARLGGEATYWYQLLDAWGPPRNGEEAFGVFDHKGEPKPLATALHNLTAILADHGEAAAAFATSPLRYSLSGIPARRLGKGVYDLLMQRSDGAHVLAIWREGRIWDKDADRPVAMVPLTTSVSLGRMASRVEVYDPIAGKAPIATLANVVQFELPLADHLMIIKID